MQAIGYDAWRAEPDRPEITDAAVADALDRSVDRMRRLDAELIHAPARGYVDFVIPYLREHLRDETAAEQAAADLADDPAALLAAAESELDELGSAGARHLRRSEPASPANPRTSST